MVVATAGQKAVGVIPRGSTIQLAIGGYTVCTNIAGMLSLCDAFYRFAGDIFFRREGMQQ